MIVIIFMFLLPCSMYYSNAAEDSGKQIILNRRLQTYSQTVNRSLETTRVSGKNWSEEYTISNIYGIELNENPEDPNYKEMVKEIVYQHIGLKKEDTKDITVTKATAMISGIKIKKQFQIVFNDGKTILCRSEILQHFDLGSKQISYVCQKKEEALEGESFEPPDGVPYDKECDVLSNGYVSKYISLTGSCYRESISQANWTEADAKCRAERAHLLILNNEEELEIIRKRMLGWEYYVGIRAAETRPIVFKTIFNETLDQVGYQPPWYHESKEIKDGIEYCVTVNFIRKYNIQECYRRLHYVCEKERRT